MPMLPRFVMLPEDTPKEVSVYIKQLEWLADKSKELIYLIEEGSNQVPDCINDIKKELNR